MRWYAFILMVLFSSVLLAQVGKVGINTNFPAAMLHVKDSSVVFTGSNTLPGFPGNPPLSGSGTRMMWYPDKAAWRVGTVTGSNWDKLSIGIYSQAMGYNTKASGEASIAFGYSTKANNFSSSAFGLNTMASGESSTALGENTLASGDHGSLAAGNQAIAMGSTSTAFGYQTIATGNGAAVFGVGTKSKSYSGFVIGTCNDSTNAMNLGGYHPDNRIFQIGNGASDNQRSNAMTVLQNGNAGFGTTTPFYKLHIAKNTNYLYGSTYALAASSVTNLNSSLNLGYDAAIDAGVLQCYDLGLSLNKKLLLNPNGGNVAIGNSSASARLHVEGGAALFSGSTGTTPFSGAGIRMMWIPEKKAFRAGEVLASQWDNDSIGMWSVAFGHNNVAKQIYSTAFGSSNRATGSYSSAFGRSSSARGDYSTSFGFSTTALGLYSFATGAFTVASGTLGSFTAGFSTKASGSSAAAFNEFTEALASNSVALGFYSQAKSFAGTVIGCFNDIEDYAGFDSRNAFTRLFQIGNGDGVDLRRNAMTVLYSGNVGIGITMPEYLLDVNGRVRLRSGQGETAGIWFNKNDNSAQTGFIGTFDDTHLGIYGQNGAWWSLIMDATNGNIGMGTTNPTEKLNVIGNGLFTGTVTANCGVLTCSDIRYKKNIIPIQNALSSLRLLQGIYYDWNNEKFADKNFGDARQIGLSAQELELVYPEMVKTDADGFKSVDYSRLTPVLVEAIKEQQRKIEELETILSDQGQQMDLLFSELRALKQNLSIGDR